jgi:hypothetical protein
MKSNSILFVYLSKGKNSLLTMAFAMRAVYTAAVAKRTLYGLAKIVVVRILGRPMVEAVDESLGHTTIEIDADRAEVMQVYESLYNCPTNQFLNIKYSLNKSAPPEHLGALQLFLNPTHNCDSLDHDVIRELRAIYEEKVQMNSEYGESFESSTRAGQAYKDKIERLNAMRNNPHFALGGYGATATAHKLALREKFMAMSPTNRLHSVDIQLGEHAQGLTQLTQEVAQLRDLVKAVAKHVGLL